MSQPLFIAADHEERARWNEWGGNGEGKANLWSRAMSSFTKSRTATSTGTLTEVRPGSPGKGRDTVITPPSTESLVVVVTALDGRELKVRPTSTSPWPGEAAPLRKLWFHGTTAARFPARAQLRGAVVETCLATFGVLFLFRPVLLVLCTSRRSSAVDRLTIALEQTLEHMDGECLFAPTQTGLL